MVRRFFLVLCLLIGGLPVHAQTGGTRFVAIAFHDIVDKREELSPDAMTTDQLVRFLDWLKGNGWVAVSLDDIAAAGRGGTPLPPRAILLTFDDGYRSLYTRVFPLLQAYHYPAVAALVGRWMDGSLEGTVEYGNATVSRSTFITWAQAREMQASGLVEFASHSYDLHKGVLANPDGNLIASARTWRYDPTTGTYETDAQYRRRIRQDLEQSRRRMTAELGRAPRTIVWPFGRSTGIAVQEAVAAGFHFAFDLDPAPADATRPMAIARYFPTLNPGLGEIADNLRFQLDRPETVRVACVSLDTLAATSGPARDTILGRTIEDVRTLGANKVILDGVSASGAPYFPSTQRAMQTDLLSRVAWQLRTRAGSEIYLRLPAGSPSGLYGDMLRHVAADGIVIDAPPSAAAASPNDQPRLKGDVQSIREALAASGTEPALLAYREAQRFDPALRLMLVSPTLQGAPAWADYLLTPPAADAAATSQQAATLRAAGWLRPELAGRTILTLPIDPRAEVNALNTAQRQGATGFALCPRAVLPPPAPLAAGFSAATYPHRP